MRTSLIFERGNSTDAFRSFIVSDEQTVLDDLPPLEAGVALLLQCPASAEILLTTDMDIKLSASNPTNALLMRGPAVLCWQPSQGEREAWMVAGGKRAMHPHEVAAMRNRPLSGLLPEVACEAIYAPLVSATRLKARSLHGDTRLSLIRGFCFVQTSFDAGPANGNAFAASHPGAGLQGAAWGALANAMQDGSYRQPPPG